MRRFPPFIENLPELDLPYAGVTGYLLQGEATQAVFLHFAEDVEVPAHSHRAQCRAPDIHWELSRLCWRLRNLQHQPELGAGVADVQLVQHAAQGGQGAVVARSRHAM